MIQKVKNILLSALVVAGLLSPSLVLVGVAHADSVSDNLKTGACLTTDASKCDATITPETKVNSLITNVINIFSLVVGVVAVIMIIIGGFRYITSGGDSGNVTGAKNTILYAVIGLVVVALAQFIVRFVLNKVTA